MACSISTKDYHDPYIMTGLRNRVTNVCEQALQLLTNATVIQLKSYNLLLKYISRTRDIYSDISQV